MKAIYSKKLMKTLFVDLVNVARQSPNHTLANLLENFPSNTIGTGEIFGCCAVQHISDVVYESTLDILRVCVSAPAGGCYKYFSVDPSVTAKFKALGFQVGKTFKNRNSGNLVTELSYFVEEQGEFWWPTILDMKAVLGAAAVTRAESTLTARSTASRAKTTKRRRT